MSGSSTNNTISSSGGSSSSSESESSAQKSLVHYKGALKAAKTKALEKGKEKAKPRFLVETHGGPPSKLPVGQRSAQHRHGMCDPSKSSRAS